MEVDSHRSSPSYYTILGVDQNSSASEIRNAYRKLAMQWHPDKWTKTPSLLEKAKSKFQQIQEAYSVLSDQGKRTLYDVGLYDPDDETNDEGFADFMQEMISLMNDVKKQEKKYSLEELQEMLVEMSQGLELKMESAGGVWLLDGAAASRRSSKRARWESSASPTTLDTTHLLSPTCTVQSWNC
ncbi:PREDICTED: chaperone protein dnaJ 6-like isoform X1 [Nelumbo nucifera]|uniref:Chaperone protein dnaJ 6-like isoform X1 n=1 Tax=Nelumbo nucifera TaxID=4432 RepID=A0A1U8Q2W6_NELNU|nr:PREDICTED: chaperone protein dnaJ 6-like isoform X1 [Nelumbo nucifera]